MTALRPGDIPASLADDPFRAGLHLAKKVDALRDARTAALAKGDTATVALCDAEIARLREAAREVTGRT
jgi:hypothetical protein